MSKLRTSSFPDLAIQGDGRKHPDGSPLEGVSANVKLLLKLIQDHNEPTNDARKPQRVAGMINILDDVRSRIEKSNQLALPQKPKLLRCNTDVRRSGPSAAPHQRSMKLPQDPMEENQHLRRQLSASMTAQKSLERMFSSLGKEKQIIASELARKVQELNEMEELVNDLKAQNQMLTEKVKACAAQHKNVGDGDNTQRNCAALEERNKELAEQLLKSLDGYRSVKRRMKEETEERTRLQLRVAETAEGVAAGIGWIRGACERACKGKEGTREVKEMLVLFERMLLGFQLKLSQRVNPN